MHAFTKNINFTRKAVETLLRPPERFYKHSLCNIKFELGITVSIGVANNKITAKLGSDYRKPDAITRIEEDNYKEIVYPLPARDLLYVGPSTEKKLREIGIYTIGELAECPVPYLTRKLGKMGALLHTFANGQDPTPVQRTDHVREVKSVGNSATTPRDLVNDEDVHLMLFLLAESVASRMRDMATRCRVVELEAVFTRAQNSDIGRRTRYTRTTARCGSRILCFHTEN